MEEMITRKLPAGIQFFSIIRKEGYLYVDKTDLVWQLTHSGDLYNYLSRPRRSVSLCFLILCNATLKARKNSLRG